MTKTKNKVCPICEKTDKIDVLKSHSVNGVNVNAWTCGYCWHIWRTEPWQTSTQENFFGNASYTKPECANRMYDIKRNIFENFLWRAEKIKPQKPRLMVDFGCSYGDLMQIFKENDWDIMGIEISPSAQDILDSKQLPWAVSMKDSGLALNSVDIVVMSDCIYYLPDPIETLAEIRKYLKPNGCLFLRQSTRAGLLKVLSKVNQKKALKRLFIDHVHMFSYKSTEITLKRAGFKEVRFHKEKGYNRTLKNEIIHRILRAIDLMSFKSLDLTLAWTVVAKIDE